MQSVAQRAATWRFDLLDQNLNIIGELRVDRDNVPQMSVDTSRAVKRTLTGITLLPGDIDMVDVIKNRVKVTMILDDLSEWPQGVFLFSDVSRIAFTSNAGVRIDIGAMSLVDQLLIVDQQVSISVSYKPGKIITDAIIELLQVLPINLTIDSSGTVLAEAISWPAGTSRLRIVNELAAMLGYHDLFFDNDGMGQLHLVPDPNTSTDFLSYPAGVRTYLGSVTRSTDLLELPNRFVVVNNGSQQTPVYARYDLPDDAPHSIVNRGFVIPHVETTQGIPTNADALVYAKALARSWRFPHETLEFTGPPDPRHDHYNVVLFEDDRFLELSWNMPLIEGGEMKHVVRRVYEDATT